MDKVPERPAAPEMSLGDIWKYGALIAQVIAVVKSLQGSAVGASHEMPTVKTWIGDGYWEANLGIWKRLK